MILKVLIVEDEEIIRLGLVNTVDWIGMSCSVVGAAASGAEGLEMIRTLKPHLVITDIRMPGMSGIDMIGKAMEEGCSFKTILLTSYAEFEYARRAIEIRACEYLLKPLEEDKLRAAIARVHEEILMQSRYAQWAQLWKNGTPEELVKMEKAWSSVEDPYVTEALARITAGYAQKLSIEGIAEELYISSSYLSRRFKAATGYTFLEMLNMQRVKESIRLLMHSTMSIAEVSEKTGFSDYKHFCSVFKRYIGMSPREFQKSGNAAP